MCLSDGSDNPYCVLCRRPIRRLDTVYCLWPSLCKTWRFLTAHCGMRTLGCISHKLCKIHCKLAKKWKTSVFRANRVLWVLMDTQRSRFHICYTDQNRAHYISGKICHETDDRQVSHECFNETTRVSHVCASVYKKEKSVPPIHSYYAKGYAVHEGLVSYFRTALGKKADVRPDPIVLPRPSEIHVCVVKRSGHFLNTLDTLPLGDWECIHDWRRPSPPEFPSKTPPGSPTRSCEQTEGQRPSVHLDVLLKDLCTDCINSLCEHATISENMISQACQPYASCISTVDWKSFDSVTILMPHTPVSMSDVTVLSKTASPRFGLEEHTFGGVCSHVIIQRLLYYSRAYEHTVSAHSNVMEWVRERDLSQTKRIRLFVGGWTSGTRLYLATACLLMKGCPCILSLSKNMSCRRLNEAPRKTAATLVTSDRERFWYIGCLYQHPILSSIPVFVRVLVREMCTVLNQQGTIGIAVPFESPLGMQMHVSFRVPGCVASHLLQNGFFTNQTYSDIGAAVVLFPVIPDEKNKACVQIESVRATDDESVARNGEVQEEDEDEDLCEDNEDVMFIVNKATQGHGISLQDILEMEHCDIRDVSSKLFEGKDARVARMAENVAEMRSHL